MSLVLGVGNSHYRHWIVVFFLLMSAVLVAPTASAQKVSELDREQALTMMKFVKDDVKKYYYDPTYHGIDLDTRFLAVEKDIRAASSLSDMLGSIAQAVSDLNDRHTAFYPPEQTVEANYGWVMQMIGESCFVVAVKPGSDAEAKGLKPGDEVLQVDRFKMSRQNLWRFRYLYYALAPQPGLRVVVRKPDGTQTVLNCAAKVTQHKVLTNLTNASEVYDIIRKQQNNSKLDASRYVENQDDVFVWQLPSFECEASEIDDIMGRVAKRKALVLDLRGNPGGYVDTLKRLLGYFFDQDLTIGELHQRKKTEPMVAKTRGAGKVFKGPLVVLIDSESGSAAELFARVIQLEKRGNVIGDRSAGAVMESLYHSHQSGLDVAFTYGITVTEADILMKDGKSLEGSGVTPDKFMVPAAADQAAQRDPVLAYAISVGGAQITPEKAGAMFPWPWPK